MKNKLQAALARKENKVEDINLDSLKADIVDSLKAELATRGFIDQFEAITIKLEKKRNFILEIDDNLKGEELTEANRKIYGEVFGQLNMVRSAGSFQGLTYRDMGHHRQYEAATIEDLVKGLNTVLEGNNQIKLSQHKVR